MNRSHSIVVEAEQPDRNLILKFGATRVYPLLPLDMEDGTVRNGLQHGCRMVVAIPIAIVVGAVREKGRPR